MGSDERPWWRSWWATWGGTILGGLVVEGGGRLLFETGWIAPLFRLLGDLLIFEVRAPVLVLLLSATLLGLVVWLFARWKLVPNPNPLDQEDYTRDLIQDVVWEWYWEFGNVQNLTPVCPNCGGELVEISGVGPPEYPLLHLTGLSCDSCDFDRRVKNWDLKKVVKKEIDRRARTGTWRGVVRELGTKDDPLEIPVGA